MDAQTFLEPQLVPMERALPGPGSACNLPPFLSTFSVGSCNSVKADSGSATSHAGSFLKAGKRLIPSERVIISPDGYPLLPIAIQYLGTLGIPTFPPLWKGHTATHHIGTIVPLAISASAVSPCMGCTRCLGPLH